MDDDACRAPAIERVAAERVKPTATASPTTLARLEAAAEAASAMAAVQAWRLACLVAALQRIADADRHELALRVVERSREAAEVARVPALVAMEICDALEADVAAGRLSRGPTVITLR